ncbi:MAG: hypothetical protein ROZ37_18640 [Aromatoleum sp.]|uniref:hypothetical protein n=1 Tax=Aromatoleum sp. TaxID=2307007 RepID=UPI0028938B43|nr:hypothetical protein [Aromatoleum sp.]MDT3672343.1 hypothetical protein [Aromatoleum sp.]
MSGPASRCPDCVSPLDDAELVVVAEAGDPDAQCDLALMFLAQGLAESVLPWLEAAARQYHVEAMD